MAVVIDSQPIPARRTMVWVPLLVAALVFIGFAQTWFLKSLFDTPVLPILLHLHGWVMSTWVALFVVQTHLVAAHRVDLHRRLGMFGMGLFVLVPIMGVAAAIHGAQLGHTPGPPPLVFLSVPLFNVVAFTLLGGTGLALRRRHNDWHQRLMLAATLNLLPPAVGRIAKEYTHLPNLPLAFGAALVVLLGCIVVDTARHRRLHPAFVFAFLVTLAWQGAALGFSRTLAWQHVAQWLVTVL